MFVAFLLAINEAPLDLKIDARPLNEIVRSIAPERQVHPSIGSQIVVISVKNVQPSDLLERVADVAHAEWVDVEGRLTLMRTVAQAKELRQQEHSQRQSEARELISLHQARFAATGSSQLRAQKLLKAIEDHRKKIQAAQGMSLDGPRLAAPTSGLIDELIIGLGAHALAAIPELEQVVYSSRPTRVQKRLPALYKAALARYEEAADMVKSMVTPELRRQWKGDPFVEEALKDLEAPIDKIIFQVRRNRGWDYRLYLFDREGRLQSSAFGGRYEFEALRRRTTPRSSVLGMLELPNESAQLLQMHSSVGRPGTKLPAVSESLLQLVLKPEAHDPLAYGPAQALRRLADGKNRNLVALLPDAAFYRAAEAVQAGKLDLDRFIGELKERECSLDTSREGWLLVRPKSMFWTETMREDRAALGRFMRTIVEAREATLHAWARLMHESGQSVPLIARYYRSVAHSSGVSVPMFLDGCPMDLLRLYGSLSNSQLATLNQGRGISLRLLGGKQRSHAEALLGVIRGLRTEDPRAEAIPDLLTFTTELFPSGGVGQSVLSLVREEEPVIVLSYPDNDFPVAVMNLDAAAKMMSSQLGGRAFDPKMIQGMHYQAGQRDVVRFRFDLAPGLYWAFDANSDRVGKNTTAGHLSELPKEMLNELARRIAALQKSGG